MPDSRLIFKPGFRVTDENGTPQSGATLEFYDAGTTNARAVYTDSSLNTSAGSTVTCDSGGYPEVSSVKALLYTGTTAYKIIAKKSDATTLWSHDNILGALDTSTFLTGNVTAEAPIVATSSDSTLTTADKGKLYNVDCSGATVTITLLSAVTATDGFPIGIRHNGTANQVVIRTVSSQTIKSAYSSTHFALRSFGEVVWITSDGAGWNVSSHVPPFLTRDISIFRVTDRRTSPPTSPVVGERYIVVGTPTGAWSSYAEHDVLEYDGLSSYIQYTPTADCGWIAYVIDEDINVQFQASAWTNIDTDDNDYLVISEVVASAASEVEFTGLSTDYESYKIFANNFTPSTDNVSLEVEFSSDGGGSYITADYGYTYQTLASSGQSASASQINIADGVYDNTPSSFELTLIDPTTAAPTTLFGVGSIRRASYNEAIPFSGILTTSTAIDAMRFTLSSGTITGTFTIYGIKGA